MARLSTEERIGLWKRAFDAIAAELTPEPVRQTLRDLSSGENAATVADLPAYMQLGRLVAANDRTAAIVAAMLSGSGGPIRPIPVEEDV